MQNRNGVIAPGRLQFGLRQFLIGAPLIALIIAASMALLRPRYSTALPWVIRTFSDRPELWYSLKKQISAPVGPSGLVASVQFVDDPRFYGLSGVELVHALPSDYSSGFVFVIDGKPSTSNEEVVTLVYFKPDSDNQADYKRPPSAVPATDLQSVQHLPHKVMELECCLSIGEIDMVEVKKDVSPDGIYR